MFLRHTVAPFNYYKNIIAKWAFWVNLLGVGFLQQKKRALSPIFLDTVPKPSYGPKQV
jgi:hypothetical protein